MKQKNLVCENCKSHVDIKCYLYVEPPINLCDRCADMTYNAIRRNKIKKDEKNDRR